MDKKTVFVIVFFVISLAVLFMYHGGDPVPGSSKYHLPEPRNVEINGVNFSVSWGFLEDENSSNISYYDEILNHKVLKEQRTFHQNDILLLDICVYDYGEDIDINLLNDGTYHDKSINGVKGIFRNETVTTSSGMVKNTHQRYYFNYAKDGKIVMMQCDKLNTIGEIIS